MRTRTVWWLTGGLVVGCFAASAALYPSLPEAMPTHWNLRGEADGFSPKPWGPFVMPLVVLGVWGLMLALPRLSPRGFSFERFLRAYELMTLALVGSLAAIDGAALAAGLGTPLDTGRVVLAAVGVMVVVMGNFLGKVTRNFFVGVRTPWTLASEEVWLRTHRFAGRLFVLTGLALLGSAVTGWASRGALGVVLVAALAPVVYSYVLYRQLGPSADAP